MAAGTIQTSPLNEEIGADAPRHRDTDRQFECSTQISPEAGIEGIEGLL